jgi:hypothetical protein
LDEGVASTLAASGILSVLEGVSEIFAQHVC